MHVAVIFPAAGVGRRFFEAGRFANVASKIEAPLAGKPIFLRAIEAFQKRPEVRQLILAVSPDRVDAFKLQYGDKLGFLGVTIVAGGVKERWETVLKALQAVDAHCTHVAVHDAARPLVSQDLLARAFDAAAKYPAVIPGHPINATLKRVADAQPAAEADPLDAILGSQADTAPAIRKVVETVDRTNLVEVQTPQIFERALLEQAYANLASGVWSGEQITDDAGLIERLGQTVHVFDGELLNFKITRPADLELAELITGQREQREAASLGARRLFAHDDED